MAFKVEGKEEPLKSLDEARRLILERESCLRIGSTLLLRLGTTLQKPFTC
jgi:hypothetical protein